MGIIIKQSIKGTFWSYVGVLIGFVTTSYLYPKFLTTEVVGLFSLLLSFSTLFAQFSSLGINGVTSRLFPYFRDDDKGHNGYLFITIMFSVVGFLLFLIIFKIIEPVLIKTNIEKSALFTEYIYLIIPLTLFTLIYTILDIYNKLLYNAVLGIFLQEFLQRLLIFTVIVAFALQFFDQHTLILLYVIVISVKALILIIYLKSKNQLSLKPNLKFVDKKLKKEIISVAFYSILTGVGGSLVFTIDKIVINQMMGLSSTGIYTIAFFFGTLVLIPSRPLLRISGTLIADAWKKNDTDYILDIYKKSCINQFIIAMFLFGGIWININNILVILGPEYESAKWVIFAIGLANVIEMGTGANNQIISFSKHYRVALYFLIILIALVFLSMILLIPIWGIVGAAISVTISIFANNLMRYIFILKKYKMQPFSLNFLLVPLIFLISCFLSNLIKEFNLVEDIIIRSSIYSIIFISGILIFRVSEDINKIFKKYISKIF